MEQWKVFRKSDLQRNFGTPYIEANVEQPTIVAGIATFEGREVCERHEPPLRGRSQFMAWRCSAEAPDFCVALGDAFKDEWRLVSPCSLHRGGYAL